MLRNLFPENGNENGNGKETELNAEKVCGYVA